jgi:hypothetical protein
MLHYSSALCIRKSLRATSAVEAYAAAVMCTANCDALSVMPLHQSADSSSYKRLGFASLASQSLLQ